MSRQPAQKKALASSKHKKYTKAAPKPDLTKEQKQKKYFHSLCDQIEGDHLENALRTTRKREIHDYLSDWNTELLHFEQNSACSRS
jgi:hypothetical protein